MADELPIMTWKVIGVVRNEGKQPPTERDWWEKTVSEIVIDHSLA